MSRLDPSAIQVVAWDFDGVLNRNIENGVFAWSRHFERDLGLCVRSFSAHLFGGRFQKAMVGEACLIDIVTEWTELNGAQGRTHEILDYWFRTDALPDPGALAIAGALKSRGVLNVMATNNEAQRTNFIETEMGFTAHVERIFAAGRMKLAKPDTAYFAHIEDELQADPATILLVDDMHENILAARGRGWQAFHFTEGSHAVLAEALGVHTDLADAKQP
ncbi:HAD-IA family hydrolase [Hyphomonas sp.]|uniref:HAD-IA family hydrolase n=1 Tax=Hyphomonas sp. TaxID=87 RepID=UPI00333E1923